MKILNAVKFEITEIGKIAMKPALNELHVGFLMNDDVTKSDPACIVSCHEDVFTIRKCLGA